MQNLQKRIEVLEKQVAYLLKRDQQQEIDRYNQNEELMLKDVQDIDGKIQSNQSYWTSSLQQYNNNEGRYINSVQKTNKYEFFE